MGVGRGVGRGVDVLCMVSSRCLRRGTVDAARLLGVAPRSILTDFTDMLPRKSASGITAIAFRCHALLLLSQTAVVTIADLVARDPSRCSMRSHARTAH